MTTLFVKNPYCRNGDADTAAVEAVLRRSGAVETFSVGSAATLEERIEALQGTLKRVVLAGGDGTLNAALPAILKFGLPMGVIPSGTANDFARSLNLPDDPVAAAEAIEENCTRQVDVGVANGHYFLNAIGIGLGPQLTKRLDREKKKRLGVLAYLTSLVEVIGERRRRFAAISVDGEEERYPFLQITVANGRHYGGGMTVCEDVEMDDGLLHMLCVRPLNPAQLFLRGLRIKYGAVKDDQKLVYRKGQTVEIKTRTLNEVTADGELVTSTPINCKLLPKALDVFVAREEAVITEADSDLFVRPAAACGGGNAAG